MSVKQFSERQAIRLRSRVTCPHCWHAFAPEQSLWIAQHPDLVNDPRLGSDHQQRFLPTRFNVEGAAIDSRGFACHGLACPNCHLGIPRPLLEMQPMFLSILGAPASGKSYFLTSMTWRLRNVMPKHFALAFGDADSMSNHRLQEYEALQFLNPDQNSLVAIEKTETQGDLYDTVLFGDQAINYPRPFLFSLSPLDVHPNFSAAERLSRVLCLYDNAGESFLPGQDTATNPVTRHLALSQVLFFLFDPTQDLRFRTACRGKTEDPQMKQRSERLERERPVRQDTILLEAAQRVRRYSGLAQNAKHGQPLVVVVTKFDSWSALLGGKPLDPPWVASSKSPLWAVNSEKVEAVSKRVRAMLWKLTPEIVSTAEGFAERVIYIPVSATGRAPEIDPTTGAFGLRPRDIAPMWAEVPLLYAMSRWGRGVVPYVNPKAQRSSDSAPPDGYSLPTASSGDLRSAPIGQPHEAQPPAIHSPDGRLASFVNGDQRPARTDGQ